MVDKNNRKGVGKINHDPKESDDYDFRFVVKIR